MRTSQDMFNPHKSSGRRVRVPGPTFQCPRSCANLRRGRGALGTRLVPPPSSPQDSPPATAAGPTSCSSRPASHTSRLRLPQVRPAPQHFAEETEDDRGFGSGVRGRDRLLAAVFTAEALTPPHTHTCSCPRGPARRARSLAISLMCIHELSPLIAPAPAPPVTQVGWGGVRF